MALFALIELAAGALGAVFAPRLRVASARAP